MVESGPVEYADQEHEDVDDDDDEDGHLSAAQLMGHEYGHGESFATVHNCWNIFCENFVFANHCSQEYPSSLFSSFCANFR